MFFRRHFKAEYNIIMFFGNLSERPQLNFGALNKHATHTVCHMCIRKFPVVCKFFVQKGFHYSFKKLLLRLKKPVSGHCQIWPRLQIFQLSKKLTKGVFEVELAQNSEIKVI